MEKELIKNLKNKLEREKANLEKELNKFAKEDKDIKDNWNAKYPNRDNGTMEEEADETQEYDTLVSLEQDFELRLRDIKSALEKIMKGNDYGKCEKCGKNIEEKRLLASPEARLCIKCNK